MLPIELAKIDATYLRRLCEDHVLESDTLDFKRELPPPRDGGPIEFLKDVSAFANAAGGDLVYGIQEDEGGAGEIVPLMGSPDDSSRRLRQILDSLEPRLQGVAMQVVSVGEGFCLVVRVPASFDAPHSIKINTNLRRFVLRNGTTTSDMTYEQLRNSFDRTSSLVERAKASVDARVDAVIQMRAKRPLHQAAYLCLNLISLAGLAGHQKFDIVALAAATNGPSSYLALMPPMWGGGEKLFNLDGLLVFPGGRPHEPEYGYVQVYRTGAFEAVLNAGLPNSGPMGDRAQVFGSELATEARIMLERFLRLSRNSGLTGPAILAFAVLHVKGYEMFTGYMRRSFGGSFSDREHLVLPEVYLPSIDDVQLDQVLRPQLDLIWQAFNIAQCNRYDQDGTWIESR